MEIGTELSAFLDIQGYVLTMRETFLLVMNPFGISEDIFNRLFLYISVAMTRAP